MNQTLEGVSKIVRVTRTSLGVVVVAIVAPIAFSVVVLLFAPIPDIAKYIFAGLPLAFVLLVWIQFWSKAKKDPLPASEKYHIEELRLRRIGADGGGVSSERSEANPSGAPISTRQETESDNQRDSRP